MNTAAKLTGSIALSALLALGLGACSNATSETAEVSATADASSMTGEKAVATIEGFVSATTSSKVAAAFPDKADKSTFADAVKLVDAQAPADKTATALADFAFAKHAAPKAKFTVTVDAAKVVVSDQKATVPVSAVTIKADGKKVSNSDALAGQVNDLVFVDGGWAISFPETVATASPSASASASPTATAAATQK